MTRKPGNYSRRQFVKHAATGLGIAGLTPSMIHGRDLDMTPVKGLDTGGVPISVVKMDAEQAYTGVPVLLQRVINENDDAAWKKICEKIDYIYQAFFPLMEKIESESGCISEAVKRVESSQTLFFKVNTVVPAGIDPVTHEEGSSCSSCTDWAMVAALMRWFHDAREISYYRMALGEGGALQGNLAVNYSKMLQKGHTITSEAILEGKSGDFYGGWGFYFARKYLTDTHPAGHTDDPMKGFAESEKGIYVPPGKQNGLYVYALDRIEAEEPRGREVPVPGGDNYKKIKLHKVIVGGDPGDAEDRKNYPGSVLVNVSKLKVHQMELMTNAIKNLGIGLYPMEAGWDNNPRTTDWRYGVPKKYPPSIKYVVHDHWHPEIDSETWVTKLDKQKTYKVKQTGGMRATMIDVNLAVLDQGIQVLHVTDAIHAVNICHTQNMPDCRSPEGMLMVSSDPVALDLFSARYMFNTVSLDELPEVKRKTSIKSDFIQKVPVPEIKEKNIESIPGYDAPLARYNLFPYAEKRGLGSQRYYVTGVDIRDNGMLASKKGRLGKIESGKFNELLTSTTYFAFQNFFWDLQKTSLEYLEANDTLTGSGMKDLFLGNLDEDKDGIVWYHDAGRRGLLTSLIYMYSETAYISHSQPFGAIKGPFVTSARLLRGWRPEYNEDGNSVFEDHVNSFIVYQAYMMSLLPERRPDPLFPEMEYGKGRWPSYKYAEYVYIMEQLFGPDFQKSPTLASMYGRAFQYADKALGNGKWTGGPADMSNPAALDRYIHEVGTDENSLQFTFYVPKGYGKINENILPNVKETSNPELIFTAHFNDDRESWA